MANTDWFNGLPEDLQALLLEVGVEIGTISTNKIMQVGDDTLAEFQERGGVVTVLEGDSKAGFDELMVNQVMPAMADLIDGPVLKAAQAYVAN